jgi:HSP20 family molecular chaperone IbpA
MYNRAHFNNGSRPIARPFFQSQISSQYWNSNFCCAPEANVLELDDRYLIEVALPGVVLDDVEIKSEQNFITIQAKRLPALFEENAIIHIEEMPFTNLVRHFEFNLPIIAEQVEARMDRGILYVSVPKLEIAHRIPVAHGTIDTRMQGMKTQVGNKTQVSGQQAKETLVK